jgi:hypothetical protein
MVLVVAVLSRAGKVDLRSAGGLAGFVLGGVGEEVVEHAVEQGGELVQLGRGAVRQGGLHALSALLAVPPGGGPAGGEPDELRSAVIGSGAPPA